jgi:pimeloyl-ACP methyl ester carboxylesterase
VSTTATRTVPVDGIGPVEVTIAEYGSGQPFLLLHGGAGPASVTGFAELFAATHDVRVLVPTHPGFGGTPRPEALGSTAPGRAGDRRGQPGRDQRVCRRRHGRPDPPRASRVT